MSGPSHGRHWEGSTRKGAQWPQGAETSLCGLGPSWSGSGLAGLSQTADHVEKTSSRLRLVPLVRQPILVSSAAAETPLCLLGLGKGLERRQRSFGACPSFSSVWALSPCPACCWPKAVAGPGSQPPGTIPPGLASLLSALECLLAFLQRQR